MVSTTKGKMYFIQCEAWLVIETEDGRMVNRKVLSKNAENHTCKIRLNNEVKEVKYYL